MKCSDCPAFILSKQNYVLHANTGQALSLFDAEQLKKFGRLGCCSLFNSPVYERTTSGCSTEYLNDEKIKYLEKISIIEKVQKHIEDRRVRCGMGRVSDVDEQ